MVRQDGPNDVISGDRESKVKTCNGSQEMSG